MPAKKKPRNSATFVLDGTPATQVFGGSVQCARSYRVNDTKYAIFSAEVVLSLGGEELTVELIEFGGVEVSPGCESWYSAD